MNEMNELEAQLRSWTLRRPSRKLELALRNAPNLSPAVSRMDRLGFDGSKWARVAAPALGCLSLSAAILMQPDPGLLTPNADQPAMIAQALSNQNFAPFLPGSFRSRANRLDTFGWTNGGGSPSSMRSLTPPEAIN